MFKAIFRARKKRFILGLERKKRTGKKAVRKYLIVPSEFKFQTHPCYPKKGKISNVRANKKQEKKGKLQKITTSAWDCILNSKMTQHGDSKPYHVHVLSIQVSIVNTLLSRDRIQRQCPLPQVKKKINIMPSLLYKRENKGIYNKICI